VRFLSQDLRTGELRKTEGPIPEPAPQHLLIRTAASLVSSGTERMLVDFGRGNLLSKARQQPERVREVVDRARAEGVGQTLDAVRSKLAQPLVLGYANAGVVVDVGPGVTGFAPGDVVASNGPHSEYVSVPVTLAAKVPSGVAPEHACFATVGAVGLESMRLARVELGERFVVSGLGLIGLLTLQLLRAHGCHVLGLDPDPTRRALAGSLGATVAHPDEASAAAAELSSGRGVDGVLVCASTPSSDPIRSAAEMCRERGRIVLVGVTGLELDRGPLYEKELSFQVSRSYGPGRYDPSFEAGNDYPFGLVRWTAARNMEAVLDIVASGALAIEPLISHRVSFDEADVAYDALVNDRAALGIVLDYPPGDDPVRETPLRTSSAFSSEALANPGRVALIGAGNFAGRTLGPAFREAGAQIAVVTSRRGTDAALLAEKLGARASAGVDAVLTDPSIGSVVIATRHDSHARLTVSSLRAGKAVYVEKPLGLTLAEIDEVESVVSELGEDCPALMVGFNRRFAPVTLRMKALLAEIAAPKAVIITVNAGQIPAGHWVHDPVAGGGRILGEGCHFIDLARHLVGAPITTVTTQQLGRTPTADSAAIMLSFADGSTAAIHYLANGSPRFPKERVEVFTDGRVLRNDNFRRLQAFGWRGRRGMRLRAQDKGHAAAATAFVDAAKRGGAPPIPLSEIFEVSRAAVNAAIQAR
jgi:predicted dehydrogenase/threonine dehydrogenase-like Zn-dependent dehydrogenase